MVSRGLTGLVQGFSRGAHSNSATLVCKASTTRCSMRRSTWSVPRSVESSSSTAAAGLAPSCDASSELFSFFFSTLVARTWGRDKQQAGFSLNQLLLEIVSNTNTSPSRLSIFFLSIVDVKRGVILDGTQLNQSKGLKCFVSSLIADVRSLFQPICNGSNYLA